MRRAVFPLLLLTSFAAGAVVIRDDVPDRRHRMAISEFPALADVPGEGHGVLIAPRWVLTAAHAVGWQKAVDVVVVGGTPYAVNRIVVHPGYRKPPQDLIDAAIKSGDWAAFLEFMTASDDIALIELTEPVRDVAPARIYRGSALGKVVRLMGRGATGKGSEGHHPHGPNRTDLRQGYNQISSSDGRWIGYTFDAPPAALPLEASSGNGDSGGPILVAVGDEWQVAGITAWKRVQGNPVDTWPGKYGQTNYGVRVEHYRDWIEKTIAGDATAVAPPGA
ncbi:S1 family peptidase [Lysobacter silvisoli]|uniref:Trypsin n=1 Tax=Lysobacter silvisoli TaxID=2293254 RepID=A0A371K074_9GAMM|nr:trypsin-like serine protease [Lysobacter silvisoli]RDZ27316.1 trypsin [Lysobacter silvisoli]